MKLIIPMAGFGTRLRPHSLCRPKPFLRLAGKTMIEHLVDQLVEFSPVTIHSMVFIIGAFDKNAETALRSIAKKHKASCHLYYQSTKLGLAHALACANEQLHGPAFLAFSDSLFDAPKLACLPNKNCIWVESVKDPSAYGVACINAQKEVQSIVEKPQQFVSDLAIIGIYYFVAIDQLRTAIAGIISLQQPQQGEYSFADALQLLIDGQTLFEVAFVDQWMDCGTQQKILKAQQVLLNRSLHNIHPSVDCLHSKIIYPCNIAAGVRLINTVVGPNVSIEANSKLQNCILQNSIIGAEVYLQNIVASHSHLGDSSHISSCSKVLNLGDYSTLTEPLADSL